MRLSEIRQEIEHMLFVLADVRVDFDWTAEEATLLKTATDALKQFAAILKDAGI